MREGDRLELSRLTQSRESACPAGCWVCFLAERYGLTPREVTLIALISSGSGMPKILSTAAGFMARSAPVRRRGRIHQCRSLSPFAR
jgi:hypothetical protein